MVNREETVPPTPPPTTLPAAKKLRFRGDSGLHHNFGDTAVPPRIEDLFDEPDGSNVRRGIGRSNVSAPPPLDDATAKGLSAGVTSYRVPTVADVVLTQVFRF